MPANPSLSRVKRAAYAVRSARDEYRAAVLAAHDAGETFAAIGEAAEVTRQSARKVARRLSLTQSPTTTESEEL